MLIALAANDLIRSLQKEIAMQKAIAKESQSFQAQVHSQEKDLAKARALADQMSKSLAEAQNENKVLQAKLASSRATSTAADRTPGSAMKGRSQAQAKNLVAGASDAARATQTAQKKEDLYSDLTGLIIRGVDVANESDIFDCIQTGRNGSEWIILAIVIILTEQ